MNCAQCGHDEEDHGPASGRWAGDRVIPGRLCFWAENQGYQEDFCSCSGFNLPADTEVSYLETLLDKAGIE